MNAPPISAQLWLRQPAKEIELADGRVYLIEFWATWCAPCLQKMPKLVELQREFGLDQLAVVAVTTESRRRFLHSSTDIEQIKIPANLRSELTFPKWQMRLQLELTMNHHPSSRIW